MEFVFYPAALIAIWATVLTVTGTHPVHALLYLIVSLLAVAMIFFTLGAPFAGALEVIVYAGAILVLFVFVVMMLNLGEAAVVQEKQWLTPHIWWGPALLSLALLALMLKAFFGADMQQPTGLQTVDAKQVGVALFGPYLLVVELASMLLLAALVAAYHLGRPDERNA